MPETRARISRTLRRTWLEASARFASYLRRRHTRTILVCFLVSSALLAAFSGIDLRISGMFFDHGFYMADQVWAKVLHHGVRAFIVASMASVVAIYVVNRVTGRNLVQVDGRKVAYLFLVLILGAGLIVNVTFKDHFGRARPRDIAEFGGSEQFTPAFVISDACDHNCSFSSGDSAGAFFALAFVLAGGRRRVVTTTGVGFGVLVSASRIASGAHFFSDTVVSFFVMLTVADFLRYHMLQPEPEPVEPLAAAEPDILAGAAGKSFP